LKYIYLFFSVCCVAVSILYYFGILKADLQITAASATAVLALYFGHKVFDHHDAKEIKDDRHSSENR